MSDLKHIAEAIALANDYGKLVTERHQQILIDSGELGRCVECDEVTAETVDGDWDCGCEAESDDRIYNGGRG